MKIELRSPAHTREVAVALGGVVERGDVIGLAGDLGAGKTLFAQGLARGLAVPESVRVTSPTFTLVNEYRGGRLLLLHADLYRLTDPAELDHIGLLEELGGDAVAAIEWCDQFSVMPPDYLHLAMSVTGEESRQLVATAHGTGSALLERWCSALATQS